MHMLRPGGAARQCTDAEPVKRERPRPARIAAVLTGRLGDVITAAKSVRASRIG